MKPRTPVRARVAAYVNTVIGENVRRLRIEQGATQADYSRVLRTHESYWRGIENGTKQVSLLRLCEIADVLGVPPARLLEGI